MYIPKPIDTSDVYLDEEIMELSELLAKNTHEVWARNRLAQGWKYGEKRDEEEKLTPCLIEYEKLSEAEKQYDRDTAMEAIKLVMKLGYKITKNNCTE